MSGPLVSVIMTHHAEPQWMVDRALASVLSQSVADIDVLLITDAQPAPAKPDPRVSMERVSSCGCYAKWNLAAAMAMGEYIAFCPADDEWLPGKLEASLAAIGDSALLTHQTQHVNAEGQPRITSRCSMEQVTARTIKQWRERFWYGNLIFPPTVLYPRALHDAIGMFDESLINMADLDFYIRANDYGGIAVVEQVYSRTRASEGVPDWIRASAASDISTIRQRHYSC
jgi:glycosyltransferase involved in cell wall biosynthesis